MVKVAIEDAESGQAILSTSVPPRPLDAGNEFRLCLWKYVAAREAYLFKLRVEIIKGAQDPALRIN